MYQWLYQDSPYKAYPLFALIVFLVFFLAVFAWAYWPSARRRQFDEAAQLPLEEDEHVV